MKNCGIVKYLYDWKKIILEFKVSCSNQGNIDYYKVTLSSHREPQLHNENKFLPNESQKVAQK